MAAYKQELKVKYGDFTFPVPTPYVTRAYNQQYVGGKLHCTLVDISINGQIALLPKRENTAGNNYLSLSVKRDEIAKEFAGGLGKNFQKFQVIGHDTDFQLNDCEVTGVTFSSANYVGLVSYSVSLRGYLDEDTSGKSFYETNYGVVSPVDSWSYSESDGLGSLTHSISAKGYNSSKSGGSYNAFIKAKSFVESKKGVANKITNFFVKNVHPDSSLILNSISEQANRLAGSYSITENYSFATNRSSVAAGLESGLPLCQTKNILTTYGIDFSEEHGSEFIQLTLSGAIVGSKEASVSWEDIRNDFKALQFYDLANKAYVNHIGRTEVNIELNKNPVSFSISPNEEAKKIDFNIVYDNNSLYTNAKFKNGGAYFNYNLNFSHDTLYDIVKIKCSGPILTRGSLKKSNRQAKILLDELLADDLDLIRQEAQKKYYSLYPDRTQYKLTIFPEDLSIDENPFDGSITLSASFSDEDHFEKLETGGEQSFVKKAGFTVDIEAPYQEYRTSPSCFTNGKYMVYDLALKTKRETVGIDCNGSSDSGEEANFNTSVQHIENFNSVLSDAFLKKRDGTASNIKRLDSESKVANFIPNNITFSRGLSHEVEAINLNLIKQ
tara:strand:- start:1505 stop:3334 length:1830 start_codon:yes stop_codon:yes gene_type:complete